MVNYLSGGRIRGSSTLPQTVSYNSDTDFDNDTNWTDNNGKFTIDATNNVMLCDGRSNSTNNYAVYDLQTSLGSGNNAHASNWVLRYTFNLTAWNAPSSSGSIQMLTGISDKDHTAQSNTANDHIGTILKQHSSSAPNRYFASTYSEDGVTGDPYRQSNEQNTYTSVTATTYYIEIIRTSTTTYTATLRTGSHTGTSVSSNNVTMSSSANPANLRYIYIQGKNSGESDIGGNITGTLYDLEFYNGITDASTVDEKANLTNIPAYSRYEETDTRKIFIRNPNAPNTATPWTPRNAAHSGPSYRGVFMGGQSSTNTIDYITIETTANAIDFGDLTGNTGAAAGCDNKSRAVCAHATNNIMDYITVMTTGNATDFGDRTVTPDEIAGLSNTTRGLFGGGTGSNNTMDYITIANAGNATDFGDLTAGRSALAGLADATRGCWGGGSTGSIVNTIDYVTIASAGNATDFGDLTQSRRHLAATASTTRGVFAGGHATYNNIDYITIQSTGNATDFGDLVNGRYGVTGVTNYERAVFGSSNVGGVSNQMDYITIASTGNATDFGDLTVARSNAGGASGK